MRTAGHQEDLISISVVLQIRRSAELKYYPWLRETHSKESQEIELRAYEMAWVQDHVGIEQALTK